VFFFFGILAKGLKTYLALRHNEALRDAAIHAQRLQPYERQPRHGQEEVHLDAQAAAEEGRAEVPGALLVEVDGQPEEEGGEAVVEEPQHEDGVQAFGGDEERE